MLLFLAGVVEQLDLALEHIRKRDVHNARFGLMLTDNALELVLHQIVKDKRLEAESWRYRDKPYPHDTQLRKAFLGSFSDKVAFARLEGGLDGVSARTFNTMHSYRNEIYHAGLAHEAILLTLARFYFNTTCAFLSHYEPMGIGWSSGQRMPARAQKYFTGHHTFPGKRADFGEACEAMRGADGFDPGVVSEILAEDMEQIVDEIDTYIQIIADGVYEGQQTTRDHAVVGTQAWDLAFSEVGRSFLAKTGYEGNPLQSVDFLIEKYPFKYRRDPISSWQGQVEKLRSKDDPHLALELYQSFVTRTGPLRAALEQSAGAAEAEIDRVIDERRGK